MSFEEVLQEEVDNTLIKKHEHIYFFVKYFRELDIRVDIKMNNREEYKLTMLDNTTSPVKFKTEIVKVDNIKTVGDIRKIVFRIKSEF